MHIGHVGCDPVKSILLQMNSRNKVALHPHLARETTTFCTGCCRTPLSPGLAIHKYICTRAECSGENRRTCLGERPLLPRPLYPPYHPAIPKQASQFDPHLARETTTLYRPLQNAPVASAETTNASGSRAWDFGCRGFGF